MSNTELKLKHWRGDQLGSERLAAALLHLEGFSSVDPQCPLGGPDGLKDVLCEKNDWKYVAAVYFPTSDQPFRETRKKFKHDLSGVAENAVDGIVFITNQSLTPSERTELLELASSDGHKALLYHLERLRAVLDSPTGYGVRLEFLRIPMTTEEQLSYFSRRESSVVEAIRDHTAAVLAELDRRFDRLEASDSGAPAAPYVLDFATPQTRGIGNLSEPPSDRRANAEMLPEAPNALTVSFLCMLHSALLFDSPRAFGAGTLRTSSIWIGPPGATPTEATFTPPPPSEVPERIASLLDSWNQSLTALADKPPHEVLPAIAEFHHRFLQIHPFDDGNGRMARYLLAQHARALLGEKRRLVIEDKAPYYLALSKADAGDIRALTDLISQAIYGEEFIAGSPCQMSGQTCPGCRTGTMDVADGDTGVECNTCGLFVPA